MNVAPILLMIAVFALMWALVLRPQQQRVRQHQALVAAVTVGDQIVTTAGIFGEVIELNTDTVIIEVAPGVRLKLARQAIGQRLAPLDAHSDDPSDSSADDSEAGPLPASNNDPDGN